MAEASMSKTLDLFNSISPSPKLEEYKKQLYDFYAKHFNAKKQKLYEKIQEITHEIDSREL